MAGGHQGGRYVMSRLDERDPLEQEITLVTETKVKLNGTFWDQGQDFEDDGVIFLSAFSNIFLSTFNLLTLHFLYILLLPQYLRSST